MRSSLNILNVSLSHAPLFQMCSAKSFYFQNYSVTLRTQSLSCQKRNSKMALWTKIVSLNQIKWFFLFFFWTKMNWEKNNVTVIKIDLIKPCTVLKNSLFAPFQLGADMQIRKLIFFSLLYNIWTIIEIQTTWTTFFKRKIMLIFF